MSLANKSLSIFIRDIFLFFSSAVVSIILARSLGPHALGLWFALNLIPSYAELFGRVKVDAATVYLLSKGKYSLKELLPIINLIAISTAALIVLLYIIGSDLFNNYLFKESVAEMRGYVILMLLQIPITFLYMNYLYVHVYREDTDVVNKMVLIRSVLSFVIIVALFIYSHYSLSILQVIVATSSGVSGALIYGWIKAPKHQLIALKPSISAVKELVAYGTKLYIVGIFSYLNVYTVQFLVLIKLAPAAMSFYTIAQQNSQLFQKLADAVAVFLFPLIAKNSDEEDAIDTTLRVFRILLLILIPSLLLAFLLLKYVVIFTYGSKYLPVILPILIILPCITLSTATSPISILFQGLGKPQLASKTLLLPIFVQIVLGVLIIPTGGVIAAAICFGAGCLVSATMYLIILKKEFHVKNLMRKLLVGKSDVMFIIKFILTTSQRLLIKKT